MGEYRDHHLVHGCGGISDIAEPVLEHHPVLACMIMWVVLIAN